MAVLLIFSFVTVIYVATVVEVWKNDQICGKYNVNEKQWHWKEINGHLLIFKFVANISADNRHYIAFFSAVRPSYSAVESLFMDKRGGHRLWSIKVMAHLRIKV